MNAGVMEYARLVLILVSIETHMALLAPKPWEYQSIGEFSMSDEQELEKTDYRYIGYKKAESNNIFHNDSLISRIQLLMDEATDRLIVGGTDMLFDLDMKTMKTTQTVEWKFRDEVLCETRNLPKEKCRNYIRVLIPYEDDKIFVCGTHSYAPQCTIRKTDNLHIILRKTTDSGYCPFSPEHNSVVVMTKKLDAFSASATNPQDRYAFIVKRAHNGEVLITPKLNSFWLNTRSFVSAYEINDFVYFFFKEEAVENINCGKVVFSRVARVCKYDEGSGITVSDTELAHNKGVGTWTTFLKTRLNCSLPGEYPFYFDELQSTYYSEDKKLVYGVFTTPKNGMAGSAVCVYSMTSFQNAFESPFKFQEHYNSLWLAKPNNNSRQCAENKKSQIKRRPGEGPGNDVLMDQAAMPKNNQPLIMTRNERWNQIVVHHLTSKGKQFEIIFLATEEGKILKMMKNPKAEEVCLIEELHVVPNKSDVIQNMKLSKAHNSLFIAIRENIIKIPLQRCERLSTKKICIAAQDPYCGWHNKDKKCTPEPPSPNDLKQWEQKIEGCPDIKSQKKTEKTEKTNIGDWSDWINTNMTNTGHFQQRFRFKCTAPVDNADDINITFAESQEQFCPKKTNKCSNVDDKTSTRRPKKT
ncbi:semaphorin-5A-like [Physella acuta]|uniref:semaphorin-5A-like n=1 Tax=Physella acuta TaxID=109671 RepID=UPI0027DB6612|nr:semaphorin-5A-like [Physella acuta]